MSPPPPPPPPPPGTTTRGLAASAAHAATPVYDYEVVRTFPHDRHAFTEGLFYENGALWESTGLPGHSFVRKEELDTGRVL